MNLNLPLELDFREEAKNIRKCSELLKSLIDRGEVVVPKVINATERVLCMSFEEGQYISKDGWIEKSGLSKADIAKSISRIFSDQIFRYGFVHCDPHEANLLVRPHLTKKGKSQIVLLDHGLFYSNK
jgi:aarF domain-containing kinase